ncbi:MAG: hypothetical protein ACK44E_01310, partial [Anaerolineales bacterium]
MDVQTTKENIQQAERGAPKARPRSRGSDWVAWLGLLPFFIFAVMFLFLPSVSIFIRSFQTRSGDFTFDNIIALFTVKDIINAYRTSL